jgi:hypothetical protein
LLPEASERHPEFQRFCVLVAGNRSDLQRTPLDFLCLSLVAFLRYQQFPFEPIQLRLVPTLSSLLNLSEGVD